VNAEKTKTVKKDLLILLAVGIYMSALLDAMSSSLVMQESHLSYFFFLQRHEDYEKKDGSLVDSL
jgi:hypothetical protein